MNRIDKYRECAKRGMTIAATARLYEVTPHAVRQANRKHGLGFVTRPSPRNRDLAALRERVAALVAQGKTRREIAVSVGAPFATVARWGRQWGIRFGTGRGARKPVLDMISGSITPKEADDLRVLKRKRYTFREAFVAMRRPDLLEYLPMQSSPEGVPVSHRETAKLRPNKNNTSGFKGVTWNKRAGLWQAQIKVDRANHCLGLFSDPAAAAAAYASAKTNTRRFRKSS